MQGQNESLIRRVLDAVNINAHDKRQSTFAEIQQRLGLPKSVVIGALRVCILRGLVSRYPLRKYCGGQSAIIYQLVGEVLEQKRRADIFRLLLERDYSFAELLGSASMPTVTLGELLHTLARSEGVVKAVHGFKDITMDWFRVRNFKVE